MSEDKRAVIDFTNDGEFQRTALVISQDSESVDIVDSESKLICRLNITKGLEYYSIDVCKYNKQGTAEFTCIRIPKI